MRQRFGSAVAAACLAAALVAAPAFAGGTNLGFEQGNTSGWTLNGGSAGPGQAWAPAEPGSPTFLPQDGTFFGFVTAGENEVPATLSQTFELRAGGTISGYAGFANVDGYWSDLDHFFNDWGYLAVNGVHLLDWDGLSVGGFSNSGWVPFSFTAPTAGFYTLEIGAANGDDPNVPSSVLLDAVRLTGEAPEPTSWAMMGIGFGLIGAALRSRRAAVSFV
jgi:hypothetical protein